MIDGAPGTLDHLLRQAVEATGGDMDRFDQWRASLRPKPEDIPADSAR